MAVVSDLDDKQKKEQEEKPKTPLKPFILDNIVFTQCVSAKRNVEMLRLTATSFLAVTRG